MTHYADQKAKIDHLTYQDGKNMLLNIVVNFNDLVGYFQESTERGSGTIKELAPYFCVNPEQSNLKMKLSGDLFFFLNLIIFYKFFH